MFNRKIQVDVVKKEKSKALETDKSDIGFERKAKIIGNIVERGIKKVGIVVCAYVILDTVRRVAVETVTE